MVERNLELEYWQEQLEALVQEAKKLQQELEVENDSIRRDRLEKRLMQNFEKRSQVEAKVQSCEQSAKTALEGIRKSALLAILLDHRDQVAEMAQAYLTTVLHWPTDVPQSVEEPAQMIRELNRIGSTPEYSALEEFVAHLVGQTKSVALIDALNVWGQQYYAERNWSALKTQIQQKFEVDCEEFQPAILIQIRLAEEATTQADNVPRYQLQAWLVDNVETYQEQRKQRTGYRKLIEEGTPAFEPFVLEQLEEKIQPLLGQWLSLVNQVLPECRNDPEFHVFLPKELLFLNVDCWLFGGGRRLGHQHRVMVCCADRLEGPYPGPTWRRMWDRHQACLEQQANETFVSISDQDLDTAIEIIEDAIDADTVVGLKLTTPPCSPAAEELFEELLSAGLPLAVWGRCDEANISIPQELDTILQVCTLSQLPHIVHRKRRESRRRANTPDRHIGHHLSLLRDNPTLIPPKSA